jgi:hypothetical protein
MARVGRLATSDGRLGHLDNHTISPGTALEEDITLRGPIRTLYMWVILRKRNAEFAVDDSTKSFRTLLAARKTPILLTDRQL